MKFPPFRETYTFMGVDSNWETSQVVILPVPYDATTSWSAGTRRGPAAIIDASRHIELYDIEVKKETFYELGIHTLPELEPDTNSVLGTMRRIEAATKEVLKNKKFLVMLGGEHSITYGAVRAYKKLYPDLSILCLDAHGDLRKSYEGSKFNHACVMRCCRESIRRVVQVGIRSLDREEEEYLIKKGKKDIFFAPDFNTQAVLRGLSKNVYLSIDLDCFDSGAMPSVGTPEPGGLYWHQILFLLQELAVTKNIVGCDVVELAPIPGITAPDFMVAKLVYKIISYKYFLSRKLLNSIRK